MKKLNSSKLAKINRLISASIEYAKIHTFEGEFYSLDTSLLLVSDCSGVDYPRLVIPVKVNSVGNFCIYPEDLMLIKKAFKARYVRVFCWTGQSPYVNFYFD
jgi:hypothetical protein